MKIMKRSLTLMLAGLMAISMVACGGGDTDTDADVSKEVSTDEDGLELYGNTYTTGLPIVKETETFTAYYQQNGSDYSTSQDDKDLMQILNEETNIVIEWTAIATEFNEKVTLALATEQTMPDLILGWPSDTIVANNLKHFVVLNDMLEEWAPNLYSQTEASLEGGIDNYKQADGNIYTLPAGVYAEVANSVSGVPIMNIAWLDAVGMEAPTTTEELKTVLTAFKEQDANGDGDATNEVPLAYCDANWCSRIMCFAGPWGMAGRSTNDYDSFYLMQDGVFTPTIDTQAMRDFLTYMNDLSNNGLVNSDGFTIDNSTYTALVDSDMVGMYSAWYESLDEWTMVPALEAEGYEGQYVKQGEVGMRTANMQGFIITNVCQNPEAALRWWDEWHRDTYTKRVSRDGLPGENGLWVENDDGTANVNTPAEFPTGIETETELNYTIAFRGQGAVMFDGEVAPPIEGSGTGDAVRYVYVDYYKEYLLDDFLPLTKIDEDQTDIKNDYQLEIEEYMDTFIAQAIVSGKGLDDAGWQDHIDTLYDELDLEGWIEWNQAYYDGEFTN